MPDHLHVLITPAIDQSTARCIQFIKGGFSFSVRNQFLGEVWHSGHHEHRIRDENDFEAQKQYIANNPIRKNYSKYPYVHTCYPTRLDAAAAGPLTAEGRSAGEVETTDLPSLPQPPRNRCQALSQQK